MSPSTGSIGTYDSLFDDDSGSVACIGFDLDVQQVEMANDKQRCNPKSWCKSSSSSCCSLCRPPIMEAADNGDASSFQSRPSSDLQAKNHLVSLPGGSCHRTKPTSSCCNSTTFSSCCGPCGNLFQMPIKSISIPRSCIDQSTSSQAVDSNDYISTGFLPDDALYHIVKFLGVASLVRLRECNRKLRDVASENSAGWENHCTSLWSIKVNVCSAARKLLTEPHNTNSTQEGPRYTAMEAYKLAVTDAATRMEISMEEICFDGSPNKEGVIWSFRFKESAGGDWTSWDPWWNQREARKLVFLRDGTIMQVYPKGVDGSRTRCSGTTTLYDVFSERTVRRNGADAPAPRIEMKWRFVKRPLDLARRPLGAYVRISVGGRDVPTYVVRRSPNGNWGFMLESCWGVYASFELAPQVTPTSLSGRTRQRGLRRGLRRTRNGIRWVDVEDSDNENEMEENSYDSGADDSEEIERDRMRNVRRRINLFVEESSMTQDGYSQWREALLYNIGTVTLPEGNGDATGEFATAWQNAMMLR
eukprot:CAMPEP_0183746378 /NCGR_PEP_ID=MMETSP0737-20130205/66727_1 /TAXON_ID=385413 /ORGANISM="Thalassiosira miniscula, Strain CCMP1093" /LENGTH=529 /DNA_ID=CAMNT_0025982073 /DNA_START=6 /DNA_END=1595 /DNA_ORIENTATION=+